MAVIPWRGKSATARTVGKDKSYDHTTIQAALDSITDASATKRYVVVVDVGIYDDGIVYHDKSFVDLMISPGAVLRRDTGDTASPVGTLIVGSQTYTEDVWIGGGGRVVRNYGISSPCPSLAIGNIEAPYASTLMWDRITIEGLTVEGVHDAVQIFGVSSSFTGSATGYLAFKGNTVRCMHDAVAMKGASRILSAGNLIDVSTGGRSPYLTDVSTPWKSTAFHMNTNRPTTVDWTSFAGERWYRSLGDKIYMRDGTGVGGSAQDTMSAFFFYEQPGRNNGSIHPVYISDPHIVMDYDRDYSPVNGVAAINILFTAGTSIAEGSFVVEGLRAFVRQKNAGGSTPPVYAVRLAGHATTGTRTIIVDGSADVRSASAAGAYVSRAVQTTDTIIQRIRSRQSNDATGAGTISSLAEV